MVVPPARATYPEAGGSKRLPNSGLLGEMREVVSVESGLAIKSDTELACIIGAPPWQRRALYPERITAGSSVAIADDCGDSSGLSPSISENLTVATRYPASS